MTTHTVSKLAADAGVSVHVVRDYVLRGLLKPAQRTKVGYGLYDAHGLARLRFVRAAFEAGIGLDVLTRLCRALDAPDAVEAAACLTELRRLVEQRQRALTALETQVTALQTGLTRERRAAGVTLPWRTAFATK